MEYRWVLQLVVVNKNVKLGTTNAHRMYLALKIHSWDAISPMHCLTSLKIVAEL